MRQILYLGVSVFALSGCAIVPEQPNDEVVFSYAEIVNQIECETYYALNDIQNQKSLDEHGKPVRTYGWADLDKWAMDISISPSLTADIQVGVNATKKTIWHQNTTKANDYLQTALGGTGASPGGLNYEGYGNNLGKNEYQFVISNLYASVTDKHGNYLPVDQRHLNPKLQRCPDPGVLQSAVPQEDFLDGFFGVHDFLERSLAATANLTLDPKTMGYTKEYRKKIQIGVTPGWYTALGNIGPVAGAYGLMDNIVGITFTPPQPEPASQKPQPVYLVPPPKLTHGTPANARPLGKLSVPPGQGETLTNGANTLMLLQQFRSGTIPLQ